MLVLLPACQKEDAPPATGANGAEQGAGRKVAPRPAKTAVDPRRLEEALAKSSKGDPDSLDADLQKQLHQDPEAGLAAIDKMPPGRQRDAALRRLMANFPRERIATLLAWADASAREEDRTLIYVVLRRGKEVMTRRQAVQLAADLKSETLRTAMLAFVALRSLEQGEESTGKAQAFAATLPEPIRNDYLRQFLSVLSSRNPIRGLNEALANPEVYGSSARNDSLGNAGLQSAEKSHDLVLVALKQGGDPSMAAAFVGGWLQSDPTAASEWVSKNLNGESKDHAALEIVRFLIGQDDKSGAAQWRDSIQTPSVKARLPDF